MQLESGITLWRYTAQLRCGAPSPPQRGEIAASTAAEARSALRRAGLVVVELQPVRARKSRGVPAGWQRFLLTQQRQRRAAVRAEWFEGLAAMLRAGLPLLEALRTLLHTHNAGRRNRRHSATLGQMHADIAAGAALHDAMSHHPCTFDPVEIAIISACEEAGRLPEGLAELSQRLQRQQRLQQRLLAALTYPALVALAALGVVTFLSRTTLPPLAEMLSAAAVPIPLLTRVVMATGQAIIPWGVVVLAALGLTPVLVLTLAQRSQREASPGRLLRVLLWRPRLLRYAELGRICTELSGLLRCGVPLPSALAACAQQAGRPLQRVLQEVREALLRGEELSAACREGAWFDAEFCSLLRLAEATGELDDTLTLLGARLQSRASRLIDRALVVLEPAAILTLATLIGLVALAALLPMVRLREALVV